MNRTPEQETQVRDAIDAIALSPDLVGLTHAKVLRDEIVRLRSDVIACVRTHEEHTRMLCNAHEQAIAREREGVRPLAVSGLPTTLGDSFAFEANIRRRAARYPNETDIDVLYLLRALDLERPPASAQPEVRPSFEEALCDLINRYSIENASDTPDLLLAQHVCMTLAAFAETTRSREAWYGRAPKTGGPDPDTNPSPTAPR